MREDLRLGLSFLVSVAELAGVATPLAKAFLAIGGAICGEDFMQDGRTLASLGLGDLDRDELAGLVARGLCADDRPSAPRSPVSAPAAWAAASRWPSPMPATPSP